MRKLALAFAALACISAPALAGSAVSSDKPIVLAQSATIVTHDRGPSVTIRTGDRHRHRHMHRRHHPHHMMARDRGCRVTTIRERRGGRVIVKKIRRC
jgi:hypothetical protein